jgi:hypothetical protein
MIYVIFLCQLMPNGEQFCEKAPEPVTYPTAAACKAMADARTARTPDYHFTYRCAGKAPTWQFVK